MRIVDAGATITPGAYCSAVGPNDIRCGPPAPEGLLVSVFTADGSDSVFTRTGSVDLGPGRGIGVSTRLDGGPGGDELRAWGEGSTIYGGAGRDTLLALEGDQYVSGGAGRDFVSGGRGADNLNAGSSADQIVGGQGRDYISAGPGDDFVRASDPYWDVVRCGRGDDRASSAGATAWLVASGSPTDGTTEGRVPFAVHVAPVPPAASPSSSPPSGGITRGGRLAANRGDQVGRKREGRRTTWTAPRTTE